MLSGTGDGSRSFDFPEKAEENCDSCHMPLKPSDDFGAKDFGGTGGRKVHHHSFPAANTGLFALLKNEPRYAGLAEGFDRATKRNSGAVDEWSHLVNVHVLDPDGRRNDCGVAITLRRRKRLPMASSHFWPRILDPARDELRLTNTSRVAIAKADDVSGATLSRSLHIDDLRRGVLRLGVLLAVVFARLRLGVPRRSCRTTPATRSGWRPAPLPASSSSSATAPAPRTLCVP